MNKLKHDTQNINGQKLMRVLFLVFLDILALFLSYFFSFWLVYSFQIPSTMIKGYLWYFVGAILIKIVFFVATRMYRTLWRYASIEELWQIIASVLGANAITIFFLKFFLVPIPTVVCVLSCVFDLVLIGGIRILYRSGRLIKNAGSTCGSNVLIVGAGEAGLKMLRELSNSKVKKNIVGFIDDDPNKKNKLINGFKVLGGKNDIADYVEQKDVDEIVIAMPSANKKDRNAMAEVCHTTGKPVKILPNIEDILNYDASVVKLRDLQIEDLLDREEITLDKAAIAQTIEGKDIMVTGGAGSIGSELCRQILKFNPKTLTILDINENSLYFLELELRKYIKKEGKTTIFTPIITSIRDTNAVNEAFKTYHPQIVYHAAAHKHVPHMERTPREAVKNNVFGTLNLLRASDTYHVERFVQISTDKAVNPTNVMGTTKRICEMMIQTFNAGSQTDFVAVRFGNVLGSNGSVIPIFKEQIANGGPVTVTHKDIIRFFMTIPEASQLVLQASGMAKGGEIFVLDMGEPVHIVDLAEKMISLSGYEPYDDIPIQFTGLRPGEKLYEELSYDMSQFDETRYKDIFVEKPRDYNRDIIKDKLGSLRQAVTDESDEETIAVLKVIVPEFTPEFTSDHRIKEEVNE